MSVLRKGAKRLYDALPFKQPLFTLVRTLVPVPERIHKHLHFKGVITVPITPGGSFKMVHHGYVIENELFWRGLEGWEKVSARLWVLLCRRSHTILDIGANTGVYALIAKTVQPEATVAAVEPVQRVFSKMQANFALNPGSIHAVHAAVSDSTGTATLYDLPESEHVLSVSLESEWNKASTQLRPVEVPCVTVMDLLARIGSAEVDLLKIDVETHEAAVLRGFIDLIRKDRPTMLIEILNDTVAQQVMDLIGGLDYLYFNIDEVTWPPRQLPELSRSAHFNFLICRPEIATSIGL